MTLLTTTLGALAPLADQAAGHAAAGTAPGVGPWWISLIPALAMAACLLCGVCAAFKVKSKLPAWLTVGCLGGAFALTCAMFGQLPEGGTQIVKAFTWIEYSWGGRDGQTFVANFAFMVDSLTCLWMLFVTGLGTLIALYASEYMAHDVGQGYNRFFAAFGLFVFSMACLVMGDNLVLLYLGWEGVGLCSYLLIGYFYKKPSAVAAAKKAFIVNRIGDLGLALGVFLTFVHFGSVEYTVIFQKAQPYIDALRAGRLGDIPAIVQLIPALLMVGAFGKSAQFPLYVWLPDAMEGPTPVSALIHAATMVTAGVYLIARTYPLFLVSEYALPIVGWIGAITALLAATIGMAQFDIKRIMAYSTVSQLGYMFCGLSVLTSVGGVFHVLTHAFFKALLFLCCGAVMHGFAGQLDLRKLSGVGKMHGWKVVTFGMLIGCLNLAGFPFTAGFFSKDMILAEAFVTPGMAGIGWILLLTAGLTAYYTFRVFFRVFMGPASYEPGDELHAHEATAHDSGHAHMDASHGPADHGHEHQSDGHGGHVHKHDDHAHHEHGHGSHFHPHPPQWAINTVLAILAVSSLAAAGLNFIGPFAGHGGWAAQMVQNSSAAFSSPLAHHEAGASGAEGAAHLAASPVPAYVAASGHEAHAGTFLGQDPHAVMYYVSGVVGLIGIGIAFYLHLAGRTASATSRADNLLPALGPIAKAAQHKWYVDEIYDFALRTPLFVFSHIFHLIDKLLVDGLVNLFGWLPRGAGGVIRPSQSGSLHGYALGMAGGLAVLVTIVLLVVT